MKSSVTPSDPRIGIAPAEVSGHLLLSVLGESGVVQQRISLAQARALSLELIRQAYQAELKLHLHKVRPAQARVLPGDLAHQASVP